ncbi:MAG: phosphoglycerate mutase family protein [Pseudomonadota bacterium]
MMMILIRHATAEPWTDTSSDFQRPLSGDGQQQARGLNRWLRERLNGHQDNDWTACYSPALRTLQTMQTCLCELDWVNQTPDRRIWQAGVQDLLDVIASQHHPSGGLIIIGHNPGLEQLGLHLTGLLQPLSTGSLIELSQPLPGQAAQLVHQFGA